MVDLMTWLSTVIIGAGCLAFGFYIGKCCPNILLSIKSTAKVAAAAAAAADTKKNNNKSKVPLEIEKLADIIEDFKMVLVVRNDLKWVKERLLPNAGFYFSIIILIPCYLGSLQEDTSPGTQGIAKVKVVVKIESEEDLLVLQERAKSLHLPTHVTIDAGRTQIAPNSRTVMAVLGPADLVDDVTGGLKLL